MRRLRKAEVHLLSPSEMSSIECLCGRANVELTCRRCASPGWDRLNTPKRAYVSSSGNLYPPPTGQSCIERPCARSQHRHRYTDSPNENALPPIGLMEEATQKGTKCNYHCRGSCP